MSRIRNTIDFATLLFLILILIVPFGALVTVNGKFVATSDGLTRRFPLGKKTIRWMDVTEVVEKEGFLQQVLILVDRNGQRLTVPFEQIDRGKELYATVREMVPKDRP